MDREELTFWGIVARAAILLTVIGVVVAGVGSYLGWKIQPAINQAAYEARATDPLVINSVQEDLLAKVTQIEIMQADLLKQIDGSVKSQMQATINRMIAELKEKSGKIKPDQIPVTVQTFLSQNTGTK